MPLMTIKLIKGVYSQEQKHDPEKKKENSHG